MKINHGIPNGIDHIKMILSSANITQSQSGSFFNTKNEQIDLIDTCICAIYQAAACHRKCYRGPHIFEALNARSYNLASSAFHLIAMGYYDKALNLIRNLGEISNIIALAIFDETAFAAWMRADKSERIRKFSPAKIREILDKKASYPIHATKDWYSDL